MTADATEVTAFLNLRPAPRFAAVLEDVPEGWELQAFDSSLDGDAFTWLGFAPGAADEPLLTWPRPQQWRAPLRRTGGRHRAAARFRVP